MNVIQVVMGDWSQDGHNHTETVVIMSDHTAKQMEKAYKAGVKKCKFDISSFCEEYEDNTISNKMFLYFFNWGVEMEENYDEDADHQPIGYSDFANIYLKTCEIGDPTFKYVRVDSNASSVNIGGYGLFSN